jgi:hypothetical protein
MTTKLPSPTKIAKKIGVPLADWVFNCYFIATLFVQKGITPEGTAVYGHYIGPIDPTGPWASRSNNTFVRHGWVVMPDGSIVDPTRWAFENKPPYIYTAKRESAEKEYDEGGNRIRAMFCSPVPMWKSNDKQYTIEFGVHASTIRRLLQTKCKQPSNVYTDIQLHWLANLPYEIVGHILQVLDKKLKKYELSVLIPIDNRLRAEREFGENAHPTNPKKSTNDDRTKRRKA